MKQALELRDLAYKAALAICPKLSLGEKLPRDDAMALSSVLKAYDAMCNRIRILLGKPLPGSRRPAPEPARPPKCPPPRNLPPMLNLQCSIAGGPKPKAA